MPVKSRAQMRKLEVLREEGKISEKSIKEFERSAKGKKLPEHVKKTSSAKKRTPAKKR